MQIGNRTGCHASHQEVSRLIWKQVYQDGQQQVKVDALPKFIVVLIQFSIFNGRAMAVIFMSFGDD